VCGETIDRDVVDLECEVKVLLTVLEGLLHHKPGVKGVG
jgi:hypothetical protein